MTRLAVLLIALLLPLQFAWSAAAAFCQHEAISASAAPHFGHHEHLHKGELKQVAGGKLAVDNDCGVCNGLASAVPHIAAATSDAKPSTEKAAGVVTRGHPSAPGGPPDRPQWTRLA